MVASDMSDTPVPKNNRLARWFVVILVLSMLGAGGWTSWTYLLQPPPEDSLVVLRADATPFRIKPATGTQADIPNQDSTFMNLIDGSTEANRQSEVISLSDPTPEPPPVAVSQTNDETDQIVESNNAVSQDMETKTQQPATKAEADSEQIAGKDAETADVTANESSSQEDVKSSEADKTIPKAVDLTAALNAPATSIPRQKMTKDSQDQMMVQLAAFRKEDKARTAAALLNQKHAERLQGYRLDVRSITSTDGQLFWRVITDPLPKQEALSICDRLKRAGQSCIIRQTRTQQP